MSLVDYASSSEDEDAEVREEGESKGEGEEERGAREADGLGERKEAQPSPSAVNSHNQRSISPSHQQPDSASHLPAPSIVNLPDASLLLNSPTFSSHQMSGTDYTRVVVPMAESASRKRETNGSASSYPRSKLPRGSLPHPRNVPDTAGGLLVPPQLSGRSNVVTEDVSKLFVKRN